MDFDLSWDPEKGLATISFTEEQLVLDIYDDPDCTRLPTIGEILKESLADYDVSEVS